MPNNKINAVQLKISLDEIEPEIWRRVIVNPSTTLHELHNIIQLLFEWYDYHLYEFVIAGIKYQAPDAEAVGLDSSRTRIAKLRFSKGDEFRYIYDFGDDWVHRIVVESSNVKISSDSLPYVMAGERRGPPEDCGGVPGYDRLLEALKNPQDPEHDEYALWAGEDYTPETCDIRTLRHAVLLASI